MEAVVMLVIFGAGFGAGYFVRANLSRRRRRRYVSWWLRKSGL